MQTGFFEEAPGIKSITRIAFLAMIANALFVVDYQLITSSHIDIAAFLSMVSATDTVSVKCFNFDGSSFNPATGLFTVKVFK
jgi:hypothetical protein